MQHAWIDLRTAKKTNPPQGVTSIIKQEQSEKLLKSKGNYGARISLWLKRGDDLESVLPRSSLEEARWLLNNLENISKKQIKKTIKSMHKDLTEKPLECNACHTQKGSVINYIGLGYQEKHAEKLRDSQAASVIKKYDKFHFPNLFIRKEQRKREQDREKNNTFGL